MGRGPGSQLPTLSTGQRTLDLESELDRVPILPFTLVTVGKVFNCSELLHQISLWEALHTGWSL